MWLLWTNHVASKARAGVVGSTFSILKLIVGAGSFVLPGVCASIGYVGLTLTLVVLASLAFYCSFLVVGLKQKHAPKVMHLCDYFCCFDVCFSLVFDLQEDLSLSEFATRKLGRVIGVVCEICILGASVGGCAVYLNFTGQILSNVYCALPNYLVLKICNFFLKQVFVFSTLFTKYILGMGGLVLIFIFLQAILLVFARWDPV